MFRTNVQALECICLRFYLDITENFLIFKR